jgi:hypothetical protein
MGKGREYAELAAQANAQGKILQAIDGDFILVDSLPPTPEELAEAAKQWRLAEIAARLAKIDLASVRPLRAIAQGAATDFDGEKLAALEAEAAALRAERAVLL